MQTTHTVHCTPETRAFGEILTLKPEGTRFCVLRIAENRYGGTGVDLMVTPELLDMISNEAERLCREFVGDVPAPSQAYLDEIGEIQTAEVAR